MTKTSEYGYIVDMPSDLLNSDEPLSVNDALHYANNAEHLRDENCQHRVNWVLPTSVPAIAFSDVPAYREVISFVFPSILRAGTTRPVTGVLRVGGSRAPLDASLSVRAVLIEAGYDVVGYDHDISNCLTFVSGTTTSTTPTWFIQTEIDSSGFDESRYVMAKTKYTSSEEDPDTNTIDQPVTMFLYRLSVYAKGGGGIVGVSYREFIGT
jgi:hypothetical protein